MTWYVEISSINGRREFAELAANLLEKGFDDRVEYFKGGWEDKNVYSVLPHLKFEDEADAIAYSLATGGRLSTELPVRIPVDGTYSTGPR